MLQRVLFLALPIGVTGCDLIAVGGCAAVVYRAIDVDVTDARTGAWIARGASGSIKESTFIDSLRTVGWRGVPPNDTATTLGAGLGRAGTYEVHVVREGYRLWQRTRVRAREGPCGVETTRLQAALEPL